MDHQIVETIVREHGYADFKWTSGDEIIIGQWVRFKCMFGCTSYGKKGGCPPAVPSTEECRDFFRGYEHILVVHCPKKLDHPEDRKEWSRKTNLALLNVERAIFLAGYRKTFLLFMDECRICAECPGTRVDCKQPEKARPSPEALGVDVFGTVRKLGYPIEVLNHYDEEMNRYSFLLIE